MGTVKVVTVARARSITLPILLNAYHDSTGEWPQVQEWVARHPLVARGQKRGEFCWAQRLGVIQVAGRRKEFLLALSSLKLSWPSPQPAGQQGTATAFISDISGQEGKIGKSRGNQGKARQSKGKGERGKAGQKTAKQEKAREGR